MEYLGQEWYRPILNGTLHIAVENIQRPIDFRGRGEGGNPEIMRRKALRAILSVPFTMGR